MCKATDIRHSDVVGKWIDIDNNLAKDITPLSAGRVIYENVMGFGSTASKQKKNDSSDSYAI